MGRTPFPRPAEDAGRRVAPPRGTELDHADAVGPARARGRARHRHRAHRALVRRSAVVAAAMTHQGPILMVPFMVVGWNSQWKKYVPGGGALNEYSADPGPGTGVPGNRG